MPDPLSLIRLPNSEKTSNGHVILFAVLLEVVHKVGYAPGDLQPQLGVGGQLTGVGVEAAVRGIVDARPDIGKHNLGDALQALSHGIVFCVLDAGRVLPEDGAHDIHTLQRIGAGLAEELRDRILTCSCSIHPREGLHGLIP